jgi:hypothetical protein
MRAAEVTLQRCKITYCTGTVYQKGKIRMRFLKTSLFSIHFEFELLKQLPAANDLAALTYERLLTVENYRHYNLNLLAKLWCLYC